MITARPFSLGLVPNWQFSMDPAENPHVNPFVSPPAQSLGCGLTCPPSAPAPRPAQLANLGSGFGATVIDQRVGFGLGVTMVDQDPRRPLGEVFPEQLGFVMRDRNEAKYGPTNALGGAASWALEHKGEIALVGGILGVASAIAWLMA